MQDDCSIPHTPSVTRMYTCSYCRERRETTYFGMMAHMRFHNLTGRNREDALKATGLWRELGGKGKAQP